MKTTQHYGLKKPDGTSVVDIEDLNDNMDILDGEIHRLNHTTSVTLTAAGWTGSTAPYTQTINITGVSADMEAILVSALDSGATEAVQKAYTKAFGIISSGTAELGSGTATFKVYKKPATDCTVGLKGV